MSQDDQNNTPNDDEFIDIMTLYPDAGQFKLGDSRKLCNKLLRQVRSGNKTASCGLWSEYEDDLDAMPVVGRCDIILDWDDEPSLVVRTTTVTKVRFCDVTEAMAIAEGQKNLSDWQKAHKTFFTRGGAHFYPEIELIFEHFELVEDLELL